MFWGWELLEGTSTLKSSNILDSFIYISQVGDVAQMVERSLSMREVRGSIPCISKFFLSSSFLPFFNFSKNILAASIFYYINILLHFKSSSQLWTIIGERKKGGAGAWGWCLAVSRNLAAKFFFIVAVLFNVLERSEWKPWGFLKYTPFKISGKAM